MKKAAILFSLGFILSSQMTRADQEASENIISKLARSGALSISYCETKNKVAIARHQSEAQSDSFAIVDVASSQETKISEDSRIGNPLFNKSCSRLVFFSETGLREFDPRGGIVTNLISLEDLTSLVPSAQNIRGLDYSWIDEDNLLIQISQKSQYDLLLVFNTVTGKIENRLQIDGAVLAAQRDKSPRDFIILIEDKLEFPFTQPIHNHTLRLAKLDLLNGAEDTFFETPVKSLLEETKEGASLVILGDTIAFSALSNPWENVSGDQKIYLYSKTRKQIYNIIQGYFPQKIDDKIFVYKKIEGSDEIQPYFFDIGKNKNWNASDSLVGQFSKGAPYSVFSKGVVAIYNSTLVHNKVLKLDIEGGSVTLLKGLDSTTGISEKRIESIKYSDQKLPAYLLLPTDGKLKGIVIYVHGGGASTFKYLSGDFFPEIIEMIHSGYGVLAVSYYNDATATSTLASYQEKYGTADAVSALDEQKDINSILAARDYVESKFKNKPIYLWGHSYGGFLVNIMATAEKAQQLNWNGIISQAGMWTSLRYGNSPAPISSVQNLQDPFLIAHGHLDKNVNYSDAEAFVAMAKKYNRNFEFYFPSDQDHSFRNPSEWEEWKTTLIHFLDEHQ
jgi:dienelactone hydrolase